MQQVDVLVVLGPPRGHEGRPLAGIGDLGDLAGVHRVHGGVGAHHGDLGGRQRDAGVGFEAGSRHRVQAGAVGLAEDHRDRGHGGLAHRREHLGAVTDDALALDLRADHEPGDVAQVEQGDTEGVAQRDEAGRLVGRVDEEHAALHGRVVGDDAERVAVEVTEADHELGGEQRLQLEEAVLVDEPVDHAPHVVAGGVLDRDEPGGERRGRARAGGRRRRRFAPGRRQEAEPPAGERDALCIVGGEVVTAPRHRGVHAGATHLLQRDVLADHLFRHARRSEVHGRVLLDHEHHVTEGRDVRAAGGGRAEQAADLRHLARQLDLVVEDPAGAAPAGEQLHLVGDPRATGVDEPEQRKLVVERCLGRADHLLDRPRSPRARLHRRVVGDDDHRPTVDQTPAGDDAVGR